MDDQVSKRTALSSKDVRQCLQGDPRALRKCIDFYRVPVINSITRLLKNQDDIEECYWETMNELPELLSKYDSECSGKDLSGLLFVIARQRAARRIKRLKRNPLSDKNVDSGNIIEGLPAHHNPESLLLDKEVGQMIQSTLDSLENPHDREIIALIYVRGFSAKEVAKLFGIQVGSVRSKLARARKRFKKKFRELFPDSYEEYRK